MKSEGDVQREVCDWLNQRGFFFWRSNNIPASGRHFGTMRALPKYTPKGLPDICVLTKGIFIGVECKRPSSSDREPNGRRIRAGQITQEQAAFGSKIQRHDGYYFCVRSVEELEQAFDDMWREINP